MSLSRRDLIAGISIVGVGTVLAGCRRRGTGGPSSATNDNEKAEQTATSEESGASGDVSAVEDLMREARARRIPGIRDLKEITRTAIMQPTSQTNAPANLLDVDRLTDDKIRAMFARGEEFAMEELSGYSFALPAGAGARAIEQAMERALALVLAVFGQSASGTPTSVLNPVANSPRKTGPINSRLPPADDAERLAHDTQACHAFARLSPA